MIKVLANEFMEHATIEGGAVGWVNKTIRECKGSEFRNEFTHRFMQEAAVALIENEGHFEKALETIEGDCYTDELMKWLSSSPSRVGLMDDVINSKIYSSPFFNLMDCIMVAQEVEKKKVFTTLFFCLKTEQTQRERLV